MALSPNTRLGPYEVLDSLGVGGPAFARALSELRRCLAGAQARIWP